MNNWLLPIWKDGIVYDESVLPMENAEGVLESIPMLYRMDKILSVRSADLQTDYHEGVDYELEEGRLKILPSGNIFAMKYDVPVLFHSGWDNSEYSAADIVAQTAEKHRGTKIVCCHCLYPNIKDCLPLTKYENLYFDLSSTADDKNTFLSIKDDITALINSAPDRVLFGSDYACCDQKIHIDAIKGLDLSEEIKNKVFFENAIRLYRI